jgi:hypothetical protein
MRVETVEDAEGAARPAVFPPEKNYFDLRANPRSIEQIPEVRQYLPLRNFLTSINGAESVFATSGASAKADSPAAVSAGLAHEFASQITVVFAAPSLNGDRKHFADLCAGLSKLLGRDSADAARVVLRISACDFPVVGRNGYCLDIRLVAEGGSAQQAELRWGLCLVRIQQALLFLSRALKQKTAE